MMTSLARQLKKLAVPGTSSIQKDTARVSILFTHKEAASLDRVTVHSIGCNGLEELINIDPSLAEFQEFLFSDSSRNWEREMQTQEVNNKLNLLIKQFLVKISPYFILKPALKALEWLVYRYEIHRFNIDDVVLSFLQYHETSAFFRVMQILPISMPNSRWRWIYVCVKNGEPISRLAMINTCKSDPNLLNMIAQLVVESIEILDCNSANCRVLVSFFLSTFVGIVDVRPVPEKFVGIIVKAILLALKSQLIDLHVCAYMVFSELSQHVLLEASSLNLIINAMCKNITPEDATDALLTLFIVAKSQQAKNISQSVLRRLCQIPDFVMMLNSCYVTYECDPLMEILMSFLVQESLSLGSSLVIVSGIKPSGRSTMFEVLAMLVRTMDLCTEDSNFLARCYIHEMVIVYRHQKKWSDESIQLLGLISRRHPESVDLAVEQLLSANFDKVDSKSLRKLLTSNMPARHMIVDSDSSLVVALSSSSASTRMLAIDQLASMLQKNQNFEDDFLMSTYENRLNDDSALVIAALLSNPTHLKKMQELFVESRLDTILMKILQRTVDKDAWIETNKSIIGLFSSSISLFDLLPFLLVTSESSAKLSTEVMQVITRHNLLKVTFKKEVGQDLICTLARQTSSSPVLPDLLSSFSSTSHFLPRTSLFYSSYFMQLLLQESFADPALILLILKFAQTLPVEVAVSGEDSSRSDCPTMQMGIWIDVLKKHLEVAANVSVCLGRLLLLKVVQLVSCDGKDVAWPSIEGNPSAAVAVDILEWVIGTACDYRKNFQGMVIQVFKKHKLVHQCCAFFVQVSCFLAKSSLLQIGLLHLVGLFSKDLQFPPQAVACLSSLLSEEGELLRRAALSCLCLCSNNSFLFKMLKKKHTEIAAGSQTFAEIVQSLSVRTDCPDWNVMLDMFTAEDTPLPVKAKLARSFVCVSTEKYFTGLLKLIEPWLAQSLQVLELTSSQALLMSSALIRYDSLLAPALHLNSYSFTILEQFLKCSLHLREGLYVHQETLSNISYSFFMELPSNEVRSRLVSWILNVAGFTDVPSDVRRSVEQCLRSLKLEADHFAHELPSLEALRSPKTVRDKRRMSKNASLKVDWDRASLILEALQSRKKFQHNASLVQLLFQTLTRSMDERASNSEYHKQLILSVLHSVTMRWQQCQITLTQETFNIEVLVRCIRTAASPLTQQQALLVMSSAAQYFPEYILHNIMSVFTFVGGGLLKQDDSHSLQVIINTLNTLIPAILEARNSSDGGDSQLSLIATIIQVFVDARLAVPRHRCLMVFEALLETLGVAESLWLAHVLLIQSSIRPSVTPCEPAQQELGLEKDMQFIVVVTAKFEVMDQLIGMKKLLKFLEELTVHQVTVSTSQTSWNVAGLLLLCNSPAELRLLQFHLTKLIIVLLSSSTFISSVLALCEEDKAAAFEEFLQQALSYSSKVTLHQSSSPAKFWKSLLSASNAVIEKINFVLPVEILLRTTSSLIESSSLRVKRRALELLSNKLQHLALVKLSPKEQELLLSMLPILQNHAVTSQEGSSDATHCQQLALFCLKFMCRIFSHSNVSQFIQLLDTTKQLLASSETLPEPVLNSALLCQAELFSTLGARSISILNGCVKCLVDLLSRRQLLAENELLLQCVLTCVHKMILALPSFLSPHLCKLILKICIISHFVSPEKQSGLRLKSIKTLLATTIPPRVLFPALGKCYEGLQEVEPLLCLLEILNQLAGRLSKDDASNSQERIFNVFTAALDARNTKPAIGVTEVAALEEEVVSAFLNFVVKFSENAFRPIFLKLFNWAASQGTTIHRHRQLAFFHLCKALANKLKGLFTLFVGRIIPTAASLIERNHSDFKGDAFFSLGQCLSSLLLGHILDCLCKCFVHDSEGHLRNSFNLLLDPLISQVDNVIDGEEAYQQRIVNHVAPCISHFFVAAREDPCWKSINYQVLLKTRHPSSKIRFGSLKVLEKMIEVSADDYAPLMPECLPFLSERMEDDCEEVEQLSQVVVSKMEVALGESLEKYFN